MSIKYYLVENKLPAALSEFSARIKIDQSINFEDLAVRLAKGGTTVTETDIHAVLKDAVNEIKELLLEGYRINFGDLCHIYPRISGNFDAEEESFDITKHKLTAGGRASSHLKKYIEKNGQLQKVFQAEIVPVITSFRDGDSGTRNDLFTAGKFGTLLGRRLRFDQTQVDEGVFLVDSLDNTEVVPVVDYHTVTQGKVIFLVPTTALSSLQGYIEIRSRMDKPGGDLLVKRLTQKLTAV